MVPREANRTIDVGEEIGARLDAPGEEGVEIWWVSMRGGPILVNRRARTRRVPQRPDPTIQLVSTIAEKNITRHTV